MPPAALFLCLSTLSLGMVPGRWLSRILFRWRRVARYQQDLPRSTGVFFVLLFTVAIVFGALGVIFLDEPGVPPSLDLFLPPSPLFMCIIAAFVAGFFMALFPFAVAAPLIALGGFALVIDALVFSAWPLMASLPKADCLALRMLSPPSGAPVTKDPVSLELLSAYAPPQSIELQMAAYTGDRRLVVGYMAMARTGFADIVAEAERCALVVVSDAEDSRILWKVRLARFRQFVLRLPIYRAQYMERTIVLPSSGIPVKLSMQPTDNEVP